MLNFVQTDEVATPANDVTPSVLPAQEPSSYPLFIEKVVAGGKGLGRVRNQVVFVQGGLPGETLLVDVGAKRQGVLHGDVLDILQPSPERISPPCPIVGQCGGCQFQHQTYEGQLAQKREMLKETFSRIGKLSDIQIPEVLPSPRTFGYRTSLRFTIFKERDQLRLGFFKQGTRTPIQAKDCLLAPDGAQDVLRRISHCFASLRRIPVFLHSLEIRWSEFSEKGLLVFRAMFDRTSRAHAFLNLFDTLPNIVGMSVDSSESGGSTRGNPSYVIKGQDFLLERFETLTLRVGGRSFVQTNWKVFEAIGQTLIEWVGEVQGQRVLELYAGVGAFGLSFARNGALVTLVEANPFALADARKSAALSHVGRCRFRTETAETFLAGTNIGDYEVILVDPPRMGLTLRATQEICRVRSPRLFYVSCDPATLARDLSRLCSEGYRIVRVQPFDMFPQTAHIETLVELAL